MFIAVSRLFDDLPMMEPMETGKSERSRKRKSKSVRERSSERPETKRAHKSPVDEERMCSREVMADEAAVSERA